MLIATLILIAVAGVIAVLLLRSGFVEPKEWAKRHPGAEADEIEIKTIMPEGIEPPPIPKSQAGQQKPETGERKPESGGANM